MFKPHIPNVCDVHKELQHLPNTLETTPNVFFRFGDISNCPLPLILQAKYVLRYIVYLQGAVYPDYFLLPHSHIQWQTQSLSAENKSHLKWHDWQTSKIHLNHVFVCVIEFLGQIVFLIVASLVFVDIYLKNWMNHCALHFSHDSIFSWTDGCFHVNNWCLHEQVEST